jgi:hypothetical protein
VQRTIGKFHIFALADQHYGKKSAAQANQPQISTTIKMPYAADLPRLIADEESGNLTVIDDKLFSMIERSSR